MILHMTVTNSWAKRWSGQNRTNQNGNATTVYIDQHSPTTPICKEANKIMKREIPAGMYKMVTF